MCISHDNSHPMHESISLKKYNIPPSLYTTASILHVSHAQSVCLQNNSYYIITATNYPNLQKVVSLVKSGVTGYGKKPVMVAYAGHPFLPQISATKLIKFLLYTKPPDHLNHTGIQLENIDNHHATIYMYIYIYIYI